MPGAALADIAQVRTISKLGTTGADVEALTRASFRYFEDWAGLAAFDKQPARRKRRYDRWDRDRVKRIQKLEQLPQSGAIGPYTFGVLLDHMDIRARALYVQYARSVRRPSRLVEPKQGWGSLNRILWPAYSEARRRYGFTDLGTYNSASKLPSGAPSDHAVLPAMAFDVGFPGGGWANLKARAFAIWTAGRPEVEYTIVGDRIWSARWKVWGSYRYGGHLSHVHVSGWR